MKTMPPIFCISLARAKDRRTAMRESLAATGLPFEIVDAVDGRELNRADYADRLEQYHRKEGSFFRGDKDNKREMSNAEIGCYLSHYNLWRRVADEKIPAAVIVEDDARWNEDFAAVAAAAAACAWEWDVIMLFSKKKKRVCRVLQRLHRHYYLTQPIGASSGMVAYMISRAGAEKLARHCWLIHAGIDLVWHDCWNWGGSFYAVNPSPVKVNREAVSTIWGDYIPRRVSVWFLARHVLRRWRFFATRLCYWFWKRPKRKQRHGV